MERPASAPDPAPSPPPDSSSPRAPADADARALQRDGANARPLVLGILGGIASGKSAVARALAGPRGVVIDADRLAHAALETPDVRAWVSARIGPAAAGLGAVDRAAVARAVFANAELRRELEALVHPLVRRRIAEELDAARAKAVELVALDVPLLLENDAQHQLVERCDALVFVHADARVRAERALRTRGWASDELARREAAQAPLDLKRARADVVIDNDGDWARTEAQVERALRELERRPARS
jgi:dephospho-CoA kinase